MKRNREMEKRMVWARVAVLCALMGSLLMAFGKPALAGDGAMLFDPVGERETLLSPDAPLTGLSQLKVHVNFSAIKPASAAHSVGAPLPDREVTLLRTGSERRSADDYTWYGTVNGHELSLAVLTVVDGVLTGHIDMDGDTYLVEPSGDTYVITKVDQNLEVPLKEDFLIPPTEKSDAPVRQQAVAPSAAESGEVIDILVLYTQSMSTKYGSQLKSKIQSFIDLSNLIYKQSGIKTKLNLVATQLYTDAGVKEPKDIQSALQFLTSDTTAASLRDKYKADMVTLLRVWPETSGTCGLAWLMSSQYSQVGPQFASHAFSVIEVKPASGSGYYCSDTTFPHELGHNMGCSHDRDQGGYGKPTPGAYSYSYGYDKSGTFATIMSYDSPRINYFSTPKISYQGYALGKDTGKSDSAYNVLTITNTRSIVANFREAFSADFTGSPTSGSKPLTVKFTDTSRGTISKWQWSFGDGTSSTQRNPSHTYKKTGKFTVSLTVTGSSGSVKKTKSGYINVK